MKIKSSILLLIYCFATLCTFGANKIDAKVFTCLKSFPAFSKTDYANKMAELQKLVNALGDDDFTNLFSNSDLSTLTEFEEHLLASVVITRLADQKDLASITKVLASMTTAYVSAVQAEDFLTHKFGISAFDLFFNAYKQTTSVSCKKSIASHLRNAFSNLAPNQPDDDKFMAYSLDWFTKNKDNLFLAGYSEFSSPGVDQGLVDYIKKQK